VSEGARDLARLVRDELTRPAPSAAGRLAAAIRERVGPASAAVVFYGSCLRKQTPEGVLDFYVLVDDYLEALGSRALAGASAALPPSVFYVECPGDDAVLRAKYAILTLRDFARGTAPGGFRTGIWARFSQPALAVYVRDDRTLAALVRSCVESILTAVRTIAPLLPSPATSEEFWQTTFRETYEREMRTESPETIHSLHAAAPERYARALRAALDELGARGELGVRWEAQQFELDLPAGARERARRTWRRRRPLAKLVYVGQLLKTAFTFGDWLPYALWKIERHTGSRIEYSQRQRRHPLLYGWPLLFRVLRNRELR
jgi:hypothetical protein